MAARLVKGAFLRFWGRADDYSALLYLNDFGDDFDGGRSAAGLVLHQ
jgi:hypothetical protein